MQTDSIIVVSLHSPKEKFWGRLLTLTEAGATIQGIDLNSFDDWIRQVLDAEPEIVAPATIFYPMHRVERIALDEPHGEIPSLAQRFSVRVGISLIEYLRMPRKYA